MKKFILFLVAAITCTALSAQNGTLDPSFGTNGKVTLDFNAKNDFGFPMEVLPDNKILMAGYATINSNVDFGLARFNPDGSPDNTFGVNGKVSLAVGGFDDMPTDLFVLPDGKFLVAGTITNATEADFGLARFNADGTLDQAFGTNGITVHSLTPQYDAVTSIGVQSDGKIVLAGKTGQYFPDEDLALARFNVNGSVDPTFGNNGQVIMSIGVQSSKANAIRILADDKILLTGFTHLEPIVYIVLLVKLNADGTPDAGFGTSGIVTSRVGTYASEGNDLALQQDGRILVGGIQDIDNQYNFILARYNADGSPDTGFGNGGSVITDLGAWDRAHALLLQPDQRILLGGYSGNYPNLDFAVVRYQSNGNPDPTFGTAGVVKTDFSSLSDIIFDMGFQSDGKLVAAGYAEGNLAYDFALARYTTGGITGSGDAVVAGATFSVHPNPAHEYLSVTLLPNPGDREVCLLNTTGKVVARRMIKGNASPFTITFDTASLVPGLYLVRITSKSFIVTERVLIW
jgi:uncharacterized delta-60 repeat protein